MSKKTIRQWLKTLPEPYRKQALMNATLDPAECIDDIEYHSPMDAVYYAFEWDMSKEGYDYWNDVREKVRYGNF